MFVPLTQNDENGWFFKCVCPGFAFSAIHERLLLMRNASVNNNLGFDDVCKEKTVIVAYNNDGGLFEVSNITGKMVEYPPNNIVRMTNIAYEYEVQKAFFQHNNVKPNWINCNFTWGWFDNETNQWTGAVGVVERDEADYAMWAFGGTYGRSLVTVFSSPMTYLPYHWLTRYPNELSPTWNLIGLFTKGYKSQIHVN